MATSTHFALRPNRYGETEPAYFRHVARTLYRHEGKVLSYGMKFWPEEYEALKRKIPQIEDLEDSYIKAPGFEGSTLAGCRSSRVTSTSPALALVKSILEHWLFCQEQIRALPCLMDSSLSVEQPDFPSAPGILCEIRFALSRPLALCEGDGNGVLCFALDSRVRGNDVWNAGVTVVVDASRRGRVGRG